MASRVLRAIPLAILVFIVYIIYTGSATIYDIVTGIIAAALSSLLMANITIEKPGKALNPVRWGWGIAYAIYYFFVAEVKAHLDVTKRILSPSMPIRPGIVRVPYRVESDYAITAVANSITNTPGTVVVDIDPQKRLFYVHWIDVASLEPEECRKQISEDFERFASRVFDG
ncbi:MAG: Na+/H+ antiporter subunit E [Crenarchaeota archaeon]|nr:Na+/H+ antiporter subunit E [Thermoproteota archaeon]